MTKHEIWLKQHHISCALRRLGICVSREIIIPVFLCENERALEAKLNELCEYIFGNERKVHFNSFRGFPYLEHTAYSCDGVSCTEDAIGNLTHYTVQDYWFLWVVKQFLQSKKGGAYVFIDVDWLKENAQKTVRDSDCPISEMPADFLYW